MVRAGVSLAAGTWLQRQAPCSSCASSRLGALKSSVHTRASCSLAVTDQHPRTSLLLLACLPTLASLA